MVIEHSNKAEICNSSIRFPEGIIFCPESQFWHRHFSHPERIALWNRLKIWRKQFLAIPMSKGNGLSVSALTPVRRPYYVLAQGRNPLEGIERMLSPFVNASPMFQGFDQLICDFLYCVFVSCSFLTRIRRSKHHSNVCLCCNKHSLSRSNWQSLVTCWILALALHLGAYTFSMIMDLFNPHASQVTLQGTRTISEREVSNAWNLFMDLTQSLGQCEKCNSSKSSYWRSYTGIRYDKLLLKYYCFYFRIKG